ncbi:MAG: hypothetical protein J2P28_00250 [Actinobacteria bacterium]|nr:hypothetical protein [Actinomycetota bacterium]
MGVYAPGREPYRSGPEAKLPATPATRRSRLPSKSGAVVLGCYLLAALALTWRLWADPASRIVPGNPNDANQYAWFVRYAADAVRHGQLPRLITTGMNAPTGINLMWNTSILLCGVILAPVTWLLGPQVSLTIVATIGFAGSASTLFWVLRKWNVSTSAAALGGAVYGFSPALLQSATSHFATQFAVLLPLLVHAGLRLAVGGPQTGDGPPQPTQSPWLQMRGTVRLGRLPAPVRCGCILGLLAAAQVFIGEELALSAALTCVLLVIFLAAARPRIALRRVGPAAVGVMVAAATFLILAGHALWVQFRGPLTPHGAIHRPDDYVNDLSTFVTPQGSLLFHTAGSAAAAARYRGGAAEYLGYLGWPLIVVLVAAAIACWRRPAALAAALTLLVLALFSLGGHLVLGGTEHPAVLLPWHWMEQLPIASNEIPARLSIPAAGVAGSLLALGIDEVRRMVASGPVVSARRLSAAVLAVAVAACLPLLPRPLPTVSVLPLPAGWTEIFARLQLSPGDRVLAVPVVEKNLTPVLRWQADTGEPTALSAGYGPGVDPIRPTTLYLDQLWAAGLPPGSAYLAAAKADHVPNAKPPSQEQISADFASWRPKAVVANATLGSPLGRFLVALLGAPTARSGTVLGWRLGG